MERHPKQKTIVFYIGSLCMGGAERVIVNLAAYFHTCGYKVTIVTKEQDVDEYPVPDGVTRRLADITGDEVSKSRILNLYRRIAKLRNIWRQIKPDYIISFIKKNNFMAITSAAGLRIPVIVSVRSNPSREYPDKLTRLLVRILFPMAKGVVLQTNQAKEFFPLKVQKKVVLLPNSISEKFLCVETPVQRKKEIVWVGRMDSNKNPRMLLRAFAQVADKYSDWSLTFIGEGYERKELEDICKKENLFGKVTFKGRINDVAEAIATSSVFVMTSKQEGMPNALIEAMVLGLAVISTDCPCGGPAELIEQGVNGILVPVDDEVALVEKLDKVLSDDKLRERLSENAKKIIEKIHPDIVNRKWLEYVESVGRT